MAEFTLIISDNHEAELIVAHEDQKFENLLADEIVSNWLQNLDADNSGEDDRALRAFL